jgi:L-cysteine S-thiosulfotransferase
MMHTHYVETYHSRHACPKIGSAWLILLTSLAAMTCISVFAQSGAAANGWRILSEQRLGNCVACHSIPNEQGKKTGVQSTFAPPLDGVASRYNSEALRQWVVDARKINPETLMPPFGLILSTEQVTDVLAALQTLR